jgi:hypothetical protein
MEKIYMLNNSQGVIGLILGLKSRITTMKPVLTMLALLMLCLFGVNEKAFAAWSGSGEGTLKNGVWYVYDDSSEKSKTAGGAISVYFDELTLAGPGATVSFQAKKTKYGTGNLVLRQYNEGWSDVWSNGLGTSYPSTYYSQGINYNSTKIQFYIPSGSLKKYYRNLKVTMAQYMEDPSKSSLNFGEADINTPTDASETFTIAWCNLPAMTYSFTGTDKDLFYVSSVANNSAVGKYNTATFTVKYKHTTAGSHSATLTIKDGNGNNTKTVTLSGKTNKLQPEVTWSPNDETFNVDDVLTATNNNGLTVTLSGNSTYVGCEENSATMLAATTGKITITAHVTGTAIYADRDITKEISITNLEKQHISWGQDFSHLKTTDGTKSITLNATSDSGLPVTYELVGDQTGLSLTQSGSVWTLTYSATECKNTTIVAKQGGNATYAPASSVSKTVKVIDPTKVCDTNETLVNSTVTLKEQSATYNIDIPSTMTIQVSRTKTGFFDVYLQGFKVEIYSGRNGTGTRLHEYSYGAGDINNSKTISLTGLNIAAKSVKLISDASNGYNVTSVTYTKQKKCTISPASLSFETYPNTTTSAKTFDVTYANYPISLECSNPKFTFSPAEFGDCDAYGTQTVSVTYTAGADEGGDLGYLYVKDNTGTTLKTCTLNVSISKVSQSITSHTIETAYSTTDRVELSAVANSKLTEFVYSASPEGVASFDGNVMTFVKAGTITITVTQPGSNIYAATSTTVENVVVSKATPDIANLPTGTEIPYRSTLNASTLSGGSATITLRDVEGTPVAGSYAWTEPTHVVMDAAGSHSYAVSFNPTNTGMYNPNTTGSISINITRAEQAIAMNNGTVKVAVDDGIDEGKADSYLDLNSLIASQTTDVVDAVKRDGNVTYAVISANADKATIDGSTFSATEIGDYTIRATKAATGFYNEAKAEYTVSVTKRANTMATAAAYTQYVDDEVENVATVVNSDGEIHTSSTDATIAYYDIANNKIVIPNSEAKSFEQTEVTIKIWQDGTTRFEGIAEADAKTITLTVKKYDNPFACSWGKWSYTANFEDVVPVEFTTANTDYANFPIVITQTSGENVATLVNNDATHNTITASYVRENATWHLSQAESYKYKAGAHDVSMLVRTLPATCYIFESEQDKEYSFYNEANALSGHYDSPFEIHGPVKAISFEERKDAIGVNKSITGDIYSVVQYSVDGGGTWRTLMRPDLGSSYQTYTREFSNADDPLGENEAVTHIRFGADRGGTMYKYYKNIKITRATNIKPLDKENNLIAAITMPQNTVGGSTTEKFYMKFSSCDEVVKLTSNNPHFTLSNTEITVDPDDANNHAEITITYSSDEIGTHNGVITLYTKYQNRTFTVSGTTAKKVQTIEWKEGFTDDPLTLQKGLVVDNTNIAATASSERPVMYSTDNVEVIEIILNGLGFRIKGEGSANLTASEAGDDYVWASVSETKTIIATGKPVQTILWDQNLVSELEMGQEVVLDAKVYIRDAATGDLTYNAERTALINYSCPVNSVISLEGNTMTVIGYGLTTITATVAGNATYVEAQPVVVSVRVREPSDGCETPLVLDHPENVRLYSDDYSASGSLSEWTTPQIFSQIVLDRTKGKPDKLSYKHNGELASIPVFGAIKRCEGTVKVQERVNGNWTDVEGSSYNNGGQNGAYNWRDVMDLQLNEDADAIRFVREHHGSGAHNFKDIQITLLQYVRPVQAIIEAENVLDLGDIEVGEAHAAVVSFDYSDVKGEILAAKGNTEDAVLELNQKTVYLDCGSHGQYDMPITLRPTVEGEWSNTVTLTDRLTNVATTITVRANVVPAVRYIFTGNEGDKQWGTNNNWDENSKPGPDDNVIIRSDVEITGDVTVGSLTIEEGATVTVTVTGRLRIKDGSSYLQAGYGDLHVADGGSVTVGNGVVMVRDFILDAKLGDADNAAASGQLSDEKQKLVVMNDAYFQMSFDVSGQITYGWYDFVVPFKVDAKNGVFDENGVQIVYGTDYIIMSHSEEKRARNQKAWSTFTGILEPGHIYTITFEETKTWNTFLFKKMAGSDLANNGSYTSAYSSTIGESQDRGWNGFGNGTLQHRELTDLTGISKVQMYNHTYNRYDVVDDVDWSTKALAVGTAFSIQVLGEQSIVLTEADAEKPLRAPKMDNSRIIEEFYLTLTDSETSKMTDRLWVSASEEATGEYVIGRDLLKMGTPTQAKVAQMWAINNNLTLCDIEMPFVREQASCALGLFAPKAGSYELTIARAPEDADLYLTYNGEVIWDLTASPYVFDLAKGTTEGYGLRLVARAPQIATCVDEANADSKSVRKVVINDKIYIITSEGEMYDIVGKSVKF